MPKGTAFCNSLVNLTYRAEAIANLADNAAASPITQIKARMATASYAASDNGSANEATYTNYVAQDVPRSGSGWTAASGGVRSWSPCSGYGPTSWQRMSRKKKMRRAIGGRCAVTSISAPAGAERNPRCCAAESFNRIVEKEPSC